VSSPTVLDDLPAEGEGIRLRPITGVMKLILIAATIMSVLVCINQLFGFNFMVGGVLLENQYYYLLIALLLPLCFVVFPAKLGRPSGHGAPWYDIVLAAITFAVCIYFAVMGRAAVGGGWEQGQAAGVPQHMVWMSYLLWALLAEALRRSGGWGLTISVNVCAFYPVVADLMPGPISGAAASLPDTAVYHMLSAESLLGAGVQAFAYLVIGFLIFGVALQYTGAGPFFINLAFALLGSVRGGSAKVAIIASGLLGSMSGSVVSNVLTAGTMTIPAMKRSGFSPSRAAAIEACASTGATLMPPVMGATAFVMASFLNVPYSQVALAAVLPSVLYYFGLFMQIDAYAARHDLKGLPREELPRLGEVIRKGWYYLFVVALLVWMLLALKRETHAPFYATVLLIVLNQLFNREGRWGWHEVVSFVVACGKLFVELMAILAGVGLLIGAFSLTGLTGTLTNDLLYMAGNNVLVLLLMGAITSFLLGLGMSTTPCYIFLAVLLAPALTKQGLDPVAVHMFLLYWGMLSYITPPVALASFAAAGLAGASPMKTSWESMYVGSIIYVIPFFFVLNPALLLNGPIAEIVILTIRAVAGIIIICGGAQGYMMGIGDLARSGRLEWPLRVLLIVGGMLMVTPGASVLGVTTAALTIAALVVLVPVFAAAWVTMRRPAVLSETKV
jgi:TRAP transporter 4TM/12TM fusion protein